MKKAVHQLLSFLMVLVMLFDAAPIAALAEGDIAAETEAVQPVGDTPLPRTVDFTEMQTMGAIAVDEYRALSADEYTIEKAADPSAYEYLTNWQPKEEEPAEPGEEESAAVPSAKQQVRGLVAYDIQLAQGTAAAKKYGVAVPVGVDMLADYRDSDKILTVDSVSYQLFHLRTDENGETAAEPISAEDVTVEDSDGEINSFFFKVDSFSTFVLTYAVEFTCIDTIGKLQINLENLAGSVGESLRVVRENDQYVTVLNVAGMLAESSVPESEDDADAAPCKVTLLNGTAKEAFNSEFWANAAAESSADGVEVAEGSIRLTGDVELATVAFTTEGAVLTVEIAHYTQPAVPVVPETTDGFAYRFTEETANAADILAANEIVSSYYKVLSVSDESLVVPGEDGVLTAQDYFDELLLTLSLSPYDDTEVQIRLTNPAPAEYTYRAKEENVLLSDVFAALKITAEIESIESSTEKIVISSTKADAASTEDGEKKETEKTETEETKTDETKTEETKTEKAEAEVITLLISGDGDLLVTAKDGLKLVIHIIAPAPAVKGEVEATAAGAKAITIAFDEKAGLPATAVLTAQAVTDDNAAFAQYKDLALSLAQSTFEQAELEKAQAAPVQMRGGLRMMKSAAPLMATQALTDDSGEAKGEADSAENAAVSAQGAVNSAITKSTTQTKVAGVFELTLQDTAFEEGDNELQPKEAVTVSLELDQTLPADSTVYAIHFYTDEDGEPQQDAIPASAQSSTEGGTLVSFPAEGFSVYAITYTVGLYSGGYTHHLMVGQSITLSKLFSLFNIVPSSAVESVSFSDPELMTVEALENDWLLTCLDHFDPSVPQTLTVTLLNGEVYTIDVADAGITQQYVAADGETYEINVKFGADAQLPVDAVLSVEEIGPEHEKYQDYLAQALAALGVNAEPANEEAEAEAEEETTGEEEVTGEEEAEAQNQYARFFDITILDAKGEKVTPAVPVSVSVKLADLLSGENMKTAIVHFKEDEGKKSAQVTTEVLTYEVDAEKGLSFTAESFSVYGVLVSATDVNYSNLDAERFTISYSGEYMTSTIVAGANVDLFKDTTDASQATVWQFEATNGGQYNIFTYDENGAKKYLTLEDGEKYGEHVGNTQRSNAKLSDNPQAFTVNNNNGTFKLSTSSQYLCAYNANGSNAPGFGGITTAWGSSASDINLTLNFTPSAKPIEQYMLVTEYEGELYIVLNDGRLEKAEKGPYGNPIGADFTTPMTWTWDGSHLYHNSLAVGYTSDQRASDFYRRYIDPKSHSGLTQEHGKYSNGTVADPENVAAEKFGTVYVTVAPEGQKHKTVTSRTAAMQSTAFSIVGNNQFKITNDGKYLGVTQDEDGTLRLQGNESEGASSDFWFADITNVSNGNSYITLEKVTHPVDGEQYYVVIKRTGDWGSVYYQIINPDRSIFATSTAQYDNTIVFATPDQSIPMWTYNGTEDACQISCNRCYLNPYNSNGITTTEASDNSNNQVIVDNEANSDFHNSQVRGRGPKFFKIDNNMLTGACGANDREEVFLAKLKGANDMDYVDSNLAERQHMVNHIDISIEGVTNLTVPLAYGTYYFKDPTTGEMRELNVTTAMDLNLSQNVPITEEDIKQGKIEAYVINPDGSYNYKNNLFTITGYSANEKTTFSTDQVRIEGNFKVANLDPVTNWWEGDSAETRAARIANKVYYNVSVTKPVTFWFVDPNRGQIYDADGEPMSITVDMTFSASFNYWDWNGVGQDHNNECPPLQPGYNSFNPPNINGNDAGAYVEYYNQAKANSNQFLKWQGAPSKDGYLTDPYGKIIYHKKISNENNKDYPEYCNDPECGNHPEDWEPVPSPYSTAGGIAGYGNSGMDFVLGGDAGEANSRVVALNITKKVVDEQGNLISLKTPMTNQFDVYYKQYTDDAANGVMSYTNDSPFWNTITKTTQVKHDNPDSLRNGYTKLHTKPIKVGASGMSLIYDYAVSPGMFYIEEQKASVLNQITDTKNQKWNYVGTYIETEYVWRDNNTAMRHVNNASRGKNDSDYKSIPDVLGDYRYSGYNGTDLLRNGFLEFTVYNVYQPEQVKIEVEKNWMANGAVTTATEGAEASVTLRRYKLVHIQGYTEPKGSLTISDSFDGITGEQYGPTVYEITGPRLDRTLTYSDLTNGSITLDELMEGDYVIKKTAASMANKIASPITETKFVSVKREQTTTVEFQHTVYSDPSGEVQTVRVGVAIATDISNLDATPYNTGIVMDVPIGTVLQLNYGTFPYEPWGNNVQDPNWYVWEWTTSESWDVYHWEKVEQHKGHAVNASITITKPTCIMIEFGDVSAMGAMNISLVNPSAVLTRSRGMKLMAAPKRGAQLLGAAEPVTIGYAASSEPPVSTVEGMQYVLDSDWNPNPIVLNSTSGWKGSLLGDPLLDKADPTTGYDYVYFISQVEENGVPANTQLGVNQDYAVVEREENGTNVLYLSFGMTNYMDSGSLSLEKHVQGVSNPDAVFWFTVELYSSSALYSNYPAEKTLADGTTEQLYVSAPGNQIKVKLKDGEKIEIKGIPAGTRYTITEDDPSQAGYTPGLQTNTQGIITAGEKAEAVMHNEFYTETLLHIVGTKVFTNGTIQENQFSFTISSPDGAPLPANTTVNADIQGHIDFGNITYTLAQLRNSSGGYTNPNFFQYIVKENLPEGVEPTEADTAAGYKIVNGIRYDLRERTVTVNVTYDNSTGKLTVTADPMTLNSDQFMNESVATVSVTKEWKKKDGTTPPPPTGTEITLNLYKLTDLDHAIANKSITLNGTPEVAANASAGQEVYPTGNTATNCESDAWVATWTNLPTKESDGRDITYVVKEAKPTNGYTVSYNNGVNQYASNKGIITNTLNETNIKVVKVDADHTETKLSGASFRLEKGTTTTTTDDQGTATTWPAYPDSANSVKTTENDGEITFTDLTDGHYRLVETQSPAGYNMISGAIEFTITNGVVDTPTGNTVSYTFRPASGATPATFEVRNTPGIVLPATGGSGTLPYYLTGLTLTLGAALWLIFLRRRRENT